MIEKVYIEYKKRSIFSKIIKKIMIRSTLFVAILSILVSAIKPDNTNTYFSILYVLSILIICFAVTWIIMDTTITKAIEKDKDYSTIKNSIKDKVFMIKYNEKAMLKGILNKSNYNTQFKLSIIMNHTIHELCAIRNKKRDTMTIIGFIITIVTLFFRENQAIQIIIEVSFAYLIIELALWCIKVTGSSKDYYLDILLTCIEELGLER